MTLAEAIAQARAQIEEERAGPLLAEHTETVKLLERALARVEALVTKRKDIEARLETAVPFADVFVRAWRLLLGLESDEEAQADIDFMISTPPPQPTVQERSGGSGDWSGRGTAAMRAIIDKTEKP